MPEYSAGVASIRIRPNASQFVRDLRRDLSAIKDPGFTISVHADTSAAAGEIDKFVAEYGRKTVDVDIDADTTGAGTHVDVWRRSEEADPVNVNVEVNTRGAQARMRALKQELDLFARSDIFRINLGAAAISGLPAMASGLAQVGTALQQVSQAGLALPGVFAGVGASVGTLVLGLSGIKDAYDAVTKAAQTSGQDQAASARAGVTASNSLRNAIVDEADARKSVQQAIKDTRRELEDLRISQRGGLIDESRAILSAQQARERLATGRYTDLRDAILDVQEADQRLIEVRSRNSQTTEKLNDVTKKGIGGADQVVSANERLIRSQQQVIDAQAAAADAATNVSTAQNKAMIAMSKLSPAAKDVVNTFVRLKPEFDAFRGAISQPLLEGKAAEFERFFHSVGPVVQSGLADIAKGWNENFTALFTSIGSEQGKGLIDRILGNTADAQSRLSAAMDPLVRGVGTLTAAGTDALPRLADGLAGVADRFANFITEADKDGRLDQWINDGISGVADLGETVLNVGKMFTAITQAAGGEDLLNTIRNLTTNWQEFLNSAKGQNALRDFFADGKAIFDAWKPFLESIPGLFQGVYEGAKLYLGGMLPVIREIGQFLGDHPGLVAAAVAAWAAWKTIAPIVTGIQNAMLTISTGLTNLGTGFYNTREKAKGAMKDVDDVFVKSGRQAGPLSKFSGALGALGAVAGPFGILAGTIASVAIPALASLDTANEQSARKTKQLEDAQKNLEATLDRVTGKLTQQSVDQLIDASQNYDTTGRPGGGVPGISKGDALAAASQLGIAPDTYIKAQQGDQAAFRQVTDVLLQNNLLPELKANQGISRALNILGVSPELLASALMGDPEAIQQYQDRLKEVQSRPRKAGTPSPLQTAARQFGGPGVTLTDFATSLAPTGQASVLSGNRLYDAIASFQGLGGPTAQANQARFGRFRLSPAGVGQLELPQTTQVGGSGQDYVVTLTNPTPQQLNSLRANNIQPVQNAFDPTAWTFNLPKDSPLVEKYAAGGPTPTGGVRGPTGGWLIEAGGKHGDEWVLPQRARKALGDDFLWAVTKGERNLPPIPGFQPGGPVPNNRDEVSRQGEFDPNIPFKPPDRSAGAADPPLGGHTGGGMQGRGSTVGPGNLWWPQPPGWMPQPFQVGGPVGSNPNLASMPFTHMGFPNPVMSGILPPTYGGGALKAPWYIGMVPDQHLYGNFNPDMTIDTSMASVGKPIKSGLFDRIWPDDPNHKGHGFVPAVPGFDAGGPIGGGLRIPTPLPMIPTGPAPGPMLGPAAAGAAAVAAPGVTAGMPSTPTGSLGVPAPFDPNNPYAPVAGAAQQPMDVGSAIANTFLSPFGLQMGPGGSPVSMQAGPNGQPMDPGTYMGQWAANFGINFGKTLLTGALGFFGLEGMLNNPYMNAATQIGGHFASKIGPSLFPQQPGAGSGAGSVMYIDPTTGQAVYLPSAGAADASAGAADSGLLTVTDPATGAQVPALMGPAGQPIPLNMSGTGVTDVDTGTKDASATPNAAIVQNANIIDFLKKSAIQAGLSPGSDKDTAHGGTHSVDGGQHSKGRALDINAMPDDPKGKERLAAFAQWWVSDPSRLAATRMLIHNNPGFDPEQNVYAGAFTSGPTTYANSPWSGHANHIHLALEGVPLPGALSQISGAFPAATANGAGVPSNAAPLNANPAGFAAARAAIVNAGKGAVGGGGPSRPGAVDLRVLGSVWGPRPQNPNASWGGVNAPGYTWSGQLPSQPLPAGSAGSLLPGMRVPGTNRLMPGGAGITGMSPTAGAPPANYAGGTPSVHAAVYRAFKEAGFPDSEWPALVNIINRESTWQPTVSNPIGAFGLFQFLGHRNDKYGALGGYSSDPYRQANAGMAYIRDRYGSPSKAWTHWQANNSYDRGGILPPGMSVAVNNTGANEIARILTPAQEQAFQSVIKQGAVPPPPTPPVSDRERFGTITPPPPRQPARTINIPPPGVGTPGMPTPPGTPAMPPIGAGLGALPAPVQATPSLGGGIPAAGVAPPPSSRDHTLGWIDTAITSGAATLGNIAATAISMGAGAGTAGMGGMGGGAAGQMVQGLFQQGGKIVKGVANVVSSALVGSVPGSGTTTPEAYGRTLMPGQRQLATAPNRNVTYGPFNGMSPRDVMQEINLHESIEQQVAYANHPGRL